MSRLLYILWCTGVCLWLLGTMAGQRHDDWNRGGGPSGVRGGSTIFHK